VTVEKIDDVLHEVLSAHGHVDDVRGEASPRIGSRLCASQGSRSRRTTAPAMRRRSSGDSASPSASIGPSTAGPVALGGYYRVDVADRDDALGWAAEIPGAVTRRVEVRPVVDLAGAGAPS
jgi:hypothetical protein